MTREIRTGLSPAEVVTEALRFFTSEKALYPASVERDSETHIVLATFRNRIAVSAFPDPGEAGMTRVRLSTTRPDDGVAKFLADLASASVGSG